MIRATLFLLHPKKDIGLLYLVLGLPDKASSYKRQRPYEMD